MSTWPRVPRPVPAHLHSESFSLLGGRPLLRPTRGPTAYTPWAPTQSGLLSQLPPHTRRQEQLGPGHDHAADRPTRCSVVGEGSRVLEGGCWGTQPEGPPRDRARSPHTHTRPASLYTGPPSLSRESSAHRVSCPKSGPGTGRPGLWAAAGRRGRRRGPSGPEPAPGAEPEGPTVPQAGGTGATVSKSDPVPWAQREGTQQTRTCQERRGWKPRPDPRAPGPRARALSAASVRDLSRCRETARSRPFLERLGRPPSAPHSARCPCSGRPSCGRLLVARLRASVAA